MIAQKCCINITYKWYEKSYQHKAFNICNLILCKAKCPGGCRNGGYCTERQVCECPDGFYGPHCEKGNVEKKPANGLSLNCFLKLCKKMNKDFFFFGTCQRLIGSVAAFCSLRQWAFFPLSCCFKLPREGRQSWQARSPGSFCTLSSSRHRAVLFGLLARMWCRMLLEVRRLKEVENKLGERNKQIKLKLFQLFCKPKEGIKM